MELVYSKTLKLIALGFYFRTRPSVYNHTKLRDEVAKVLYCNVSNKLNLTIVIVFIVLVAIAALNLIGKLPALIFSIATIGGFFLWLATTYKTPIDPYKVIIPYLLSIIFFMIHVYEEYLTDFEVALTDITGLHVLERNFLTVAAFVGPIIWLTGAILLLKRTQLGYYFLSFFFVAMTIAELSHFVFPFLEDGTFHYVSGMYTAALPLIPAGYGLYIVLKEIRNIRQTH